MLATALMAPLLISTPYMTTATPNLTDRVRESHQHVAVPAIAIYTHNFGESGSQQPTLAEVVRVQDNGWCGDMLVRFPDPVSQIGRCGCHTGCEDTIGVP